MDEREYYRVRRRPGEVRTRKQAGRMKNKPNKVNMTEFSKLMIRRYANMCIWWISISYILAIWGKEVNEGVTVAVITSLAAVLLVYFIKSATENVFKHMGDKYKGKEREGED